MSEILNLMANVQHLRSPCEHPMVGTGTIIQRGRWHVLQSKCNNAHQSKSMVKLVLLYFPSQI